MATSAMMASNATITALAPRLRQHRQAADAPTPLRAPRTRALPPCVRQVAVRAKKDDEEGAVSNSEVARRAILAASGIALLAPVLKIIVNDLGYEIADDDSQPARAPLPDPGTKYALATFAGGCFWCMEAPFDRIPGVLATTSGYTGGSKQKPTYLEVSAGRTGHAEAVQIMYDPTVCSFDTLLDVYWHQVDPTTPDRQFVDKGPQYRTAIFYHNEEQRKAAEAAKERFEREGTFGKGRKIVTQIAAASKFWPAEQYHQDYYERNAPRYQIYRALSGRDNYIASIWGEENVVHG